MFEGINGGTTVNSGFTLGLRMEFVLEQTRRRLVSMDAGRWWGN